MSNTRSYNLFRLKELDDKADALRKELGISGRSEIIWQADYSDGLLLVSADGKGGADLMVVEGNYPVDYMLERSKHFSTEHAATEAANMINNYNHGDPSERDALQEKYKFESDLLDEIFGKE
jgi:hypothetical protein